jgi:hypothetical protein
MRSFTSFSLAIIDDVDMHAMKRSPRTAADIESANRALLAALGEPADLSLALSLTEPQWDQLADVAARHRALPLLYQRLRAAGAAGAVPAAARTRMHDTYVDATLRAALLQREAANAIRALDARGIPTLVLKGMHLAADIYPEPSLRSMADMDVMTPRRDLAAAEQLFLELGYGPTPRPDLEEFCSWSNHLAKLQRKSFTFEIHWHIERPGSPFVIPIDDLWSRARPIRIEGVATLALAPEDLLIHLSLHASYHHRYARAPFKALLDVAAVIARFGDEIDWAALCANANAWGAGRFVFTTLELARAVLKVPVSPRVIAALHREPGDAEMVAVAARYVTSPFEPLPATLEELADTEGGVSRLRLLARSLFLPPRKISERYGFRPGSPVTPLLYLLRPFDLLYRRIPLLAQAVASSPEARGVRQREADRKRINRWVEESERATGAP